MKTLSRITLLMLFSVLFSVFARGGTYYVSDNPCSNNLTTSPACPGDFAYVAANAPEGSIIYVEAGYYIGVKVTVGNDDITIRGVQNLNTLAQPTWQPPVNKGEPFDANGASQYPILIGLDLDRQEETAIRVLSKSEVTLENIIVSHYNVGFNFWNCEYPVVNRCIAMELGWAVQDTDPNDNEAEDYKGKGIVFAHCPGGLITNCYVKNVGAEGISINGGNMTVRYCRVYTDALEPYLPAAHHSNGTDYFFQSSSYKIGSTLYPSTGNTIEHCVVERTITTPHSGKGIALSSAAWEISPGNWLTADCHDNLVRDCYVYNTGSSLTCRYNFCHDNKFQDCIVEKGVAIRTIDGADGNHFDRIQHIDGGAAYLLGGFRVHSSPNIGLVMEDNLVTNSAFESNVVLNQYSNAAPAGSSFKNTRFVNCTFDARRSTNPVYYSNIVGTRNTIHIGTEFTNCIFNDFQLVVRSNTNLPPSGTVTFRKACVNSDFTVSDMQNDARLNMSASEPSFDGDPLFVDRANNDYHLKSNSPCRDFGANLYNLYGLTFLLDMMNNPDVYGGTRLISTFDIGADEYDPAEPKALGPPNKSMQPTQVLSSEQPKLYPNPATSNITVSAAPGSALEVIDMNGKLVLQSPLIAGSTNLDITDLPAGVYHVVISSAQQKTIERLVIAR